MSRPKVIVNCVAQRHAGPTERIIEFADRETGKGGLISFCRLADDTLAVDVYRCDKGIRVLGPRNEG